jgi:L-ascorbate metabolism protein UlaG (beta-lactamase superfamily)
MGPEDAAKAVEFLKPKTVIPMHYNTFDVIQQDPGKFKAMVEKGNVKCEVVEPGGTFELK